MEALRGYEIQRLTVAVGSRTYALLAPARPEALLDDVRVQARFDQDQYMPYWATLWPAALALADVVAAWPSVEPTPDPPALLELGCGLGLVGLVAAERGWQVTLSDYDDDALAFARANAAENGLPEPATRWIDWRQRYDDLRPQRILAADVLYERRHLEPVAAFIADHLAPGGLALVSDANRSTADPFPQIAMRHGFEVTARPIARPGLTPGEQVQARVFELRRAAEVAW